MSKRANKQTNGLKNIQKAAWKKITKPMRGKKNEVLHSISEQK